MLQGGWAKVGKAGKANTVKKGKPGKLYVSRIGVLDQREKQFWATKETKGADGKKILDTRP